MSKFLALLKSKKFWALVTAIVAALAAFFTTSCAAQAKVYREGVHIDTVRVDYIIRSKSFQTIAQCQTKSSTNFQSRSIPKSFPSIPAFGNSIESVPIISSLPVISNGVSTLSILLRSSCSRFLSPSNTTKSISFTTSTPFFSAMGPQYSSRPIYRTFGEKCLIAFVPIAFVKRSRRRGGRKGRPKGTKTIPLGGSHL